MSPAQPRSEAAAAWCLRLAEGPLTPEEQAAFHAWLGADPANPAAFDAAVALWGAVGEQAGSAEMIGLRSAALDSARRAAAARWAGGLLRSRRVMAAAAALLVAVFAGVWALGLPATYATGVGEREVVVLGDGSKLSLDADTRVNVRYSHGRRQLALKRGRARFSVAKDPLRPFTVTAAGKTVVAVGTEFSVERLGGQVRVILYEGKVTVLKASSAGPSPVAVGPSRRPAEAVLRPGGELVMPDAAPVAQLASADLSRSLSWEGGQLVFDDEPLGRAVERVNRYAARKIVVADAAAARVPVSGVFTAGDTDAFVGGVARVFPIHAEREGDGQTVLSFDPGRSAPLAAE